MLFPFLKKILIICFTNNPYKIKKYRQIYESPVGCGLDRPESLSAILYHEQGDVENYALPKTVLDQDLNHRYISNNLRFSLSGIFKAPDRYVFSVSGACILGQIGLIYDPKTRSFIDESAKEWIIDLERSPFLNAFKLPSKTYLKGITLSFLTLGADGGFYHFLFESLIKTGMYKSLIHQANQFLFNGPSTPWKLKWLKTTDIDTSKIIWVTNMGHYDCEQLIFTNKLVADQQINKWCIETLRKTFGVYTVKDNLPAVKNVIWISQKGVNSRYIKWEDDIIERLPYIKVVDLYHLDADETIDIFSKATHVIGAHGAGFSNLYLCQNGTKVLEIFPEGAFFVPCYSRLSQVCDIDHHVIYLDFLNKNNPGIGLDTLTGVLSKFVC